MKRIKTARDVNQLFGRNVKFYRTARGWSQEKLAEQLNVSKNTVHDIETGRKFARAQKLIEFAAVFNIDVYKLFLPEELSDYDSIKAVAKYAENAKDALKNLLDDYMKSPNKQH